VAAAVHAINIAADVDELPDTEPAARPSQEP
jgi:hypothetical protein